MSEIRREVRANLESPNVPTQDRASGMGVAKRVHSKKTQFAHRALAPPHLRPVSNSPPDDPEHQAPSDTPAWVVFWIFPGWTIPSEELGTPPNHMYVELPQQPVILKQAQPQQDIPMVSAEPIPQDKGKQRVYPWQPPINTAGPSGTSAP
ncbi:uncharacterized protein EI90DRAFT_3128082 [Cantharellus anzutake]|uniref:uncharacterized protein n=1 Tax=Cantharellus anzutake TaxID=1750568 RepID=UPI0019083442|nr:uncharacterized protein EI90DRAFT_3128082 [Cantharellus anzutake]KAF8326199.1 hypothetical protein EI90DRAFT_3128082 [Cantharellus anzutake]